MLPGYACSVCALLGISVPQLSVLPNVPMDILCCPWTYLFYSSLRCPPRRVCSTAVSDVQGSVSPTAACASPRRVCSTAACAVPGSGWPTAACAAPRRVCLQDPVHTIRVCRCLLCWTWTYLCTLHLYVSVHTGAFVLHLNVSIL